MTILDHNKNNIATHLFFLKTPQGQSFLEYVVIIAVVVAALISMKNYMRRGVEGYLRGSVDEEQQYIPGDTTYKYVTVQPNPITTTETFGLDGGVFKKGVYKYTLDATSPVTRSADGSNGSVAEHYTNTLDTGNLFKDK
jgi:hypothetical protein